ncbi:hypothetical protein HAX54_013502, partial [Datura stramonium]|nr:hypothetical protein [Datura stramonium]
CELKVVEKIEYSRKGKHSTSKGWLERWTTSSRCGPSILMSLEAKYGRVLFEESRMTVRCVNCILA